MDCCTDSCDPRRSTGAEELWSWNRRLDCRAHARSSLSSQSGYMGRLVRSADPIDAQAEGSGVERSTGNEQKPAGCRSRALAASGLGKDAGTPT